MPVLDNLSAKQAGFKADEAYQKASIFLVEKPN